jgi:hypothetical protein
MPFLIITGFTITIVMILSGFVIINYFKNYPLISNFYYVLISTIPLLFISFGFNLFLIVTNKPRTLLYISIISIAILYFLSMLIIPFYLINGILYTYVIAQFTACIILPFIFIKAAKSVLYNSFKILISKLFYINLYKQLNFINSNITN